MGSKMRIFALGVLVIGAGATISDLDHLTHQARAWGHNPTAIDIILLILAVTYLGRLFKSWILRGG